MTKCVDLTDKVFNRLTVVRRAENDKRGSARWLCKCICGKDVITSSSHLNSEHTKSCGCHRKEQLWKGNTTHGLKNHPLYEVHRSMIKRCEDPNNIGYHRYGGRGIKVCAEWRNNVVAFYNWAIGNGWDKGLQIDRIDNDGNYCPENCRITTPQVNNHNKPNLSSVNTSGFTGVFFHKNHNHYETHIRSKDLSSGNKLIHIGCFKTPEEAVIARDRFIIKHNLPHKLQVLER